MSTALEISAIVCVRRMLTSELEVVFTILESFDAGRVLWQVCSATDVLRAQSLSAAAGGNRGCVEQKQRGKEGHDCSKVEV